MAPFAAPGSVPGAVLQCAERRARDAANGEGLQLEGLELSHGLAHVAWSRWRSLPCGNDWPSLLLKMGQWR